MKLIKRKKKKVKTKVSGKYEKKKLKEMRRQKKDKELVEDLLNNSTQMDNETFESEVIKSNEPTFVFFTAPWCGVCKTVKPVWEKVKQVSKVKMVEFDVEQNTQVANDYQIMTLPSFLMFKNGLPVAGLKGSVNEAKLTEEISKVS